MRVGKSFHRLVNVLAIIDRDGEILENLDRIFRGVSHRWRCIRFFNDAALFAASVAS